MSDPTTGEAIHVRGGSGGVTATTEAIDASGAQLLSVARVLAGLVPQAAGIGLTSGLAVAATLDPFGSARTYATLAVAVSGHDGLAPCAAAVAELGMQTRLAARAYALAELEADQVLSAVWRQAAPQLLTTAVRVAAPVSGWLALGALVGAGGWTAVRSVPVGVQTAGDLVGDAARGRLTWRMAGVRVALASARVEKQLGADASAVLLELQEWSARNPWAARELIATAPLVLERMVPPLLDDVLAVAPLEVGGTTVDDVPDTAPELAALMAGIGLATGALRQGDVQVRPAGSASVTLAPLTVRGAVGRLAALTAPRSGPHRYAFSPGEIRLDRISEGGTIRWQLYLPPTQTWSTRGGPLPADGTSNLATMGGVHSDAVEAAVETMRAAGVGADDPVMAVGYSQGGLVAAALASDPAVQDEFRVRQVLTVGSPVSGFDVPSDVEMLSIEHDADLVPQLDGDRNPDLPHWATVHRDVLDPETGFGDGADIEADFEADPWLGHDYDGYLDTATLVDASSHPSVVSWREALVRFAGGADAEVTTQHWSTVRSD